MKLLELSNKYCDNKRIHQNFKFHKKADFAANDAVDWKY